MTRFSKLPDQMTMTRLAEAFGTSRSSVHKTLRKKQFPLIEEPGRLPRVGKEDLLTYGDMLPDIWRLKIGMMRILDVSRADEAHMIAESVLGDD